MKYETSYPHTSAVSIVNRRRVYTYSPVYTDPQLQQLSELVQTALGAKFVGFIAETAGQATTISIEWNEVDQAAEIAAIDQAFADWQALLSEGG